MNKEEWYEMRLEAWADNTQKRSTVSFIMAQCMSQLHFLKDHTVYGIENRPEGSQSAKQLQECHCIPGQWQLLVG